jgi:hypothetical protein
MQEGRILLPSNCSGTLKLYARLTATIEYCRDINSNQHTFRKGLLIYDHGLVVHGITYSYVQSRHFLGPSIVPLFKKAY